MKKLHNEFIIKDNFGGYFDNNGHFIICEEYGISDADTDKYAVEVINGDGYYSENGNFIRFKDNEAE